MSKIKRALPEDVDVTPDGAGVNMEDFQRHYAPEVDEDTEDWTDAESEADLLASMDEDRYQQDQA